MEWLYHSQILFQNGNVLCKGALNLSGLVITVIRAGLSCRVMSLCIGHTFFILFYFFYRFCVHTGIVQNLTLFGTSDLYFAVRLQVNFLQP